MKTRHQQIQSHLKKVDVSRFPVVSNQATQELNYVAVNKHSQNTPGSTKQWMNERLPKLVQSRHLENILKQMAPQELDKVLWIESYAEITKRNGDDKGLDSLKIMPLDGI